MLRIDETFKFFWNSEVNNEFTLKMNFGNLESTTCLELMNNLMRGIVASGISCKDFKTRVEF